MLDDSPFFVREDGVSIMNGANEGMLGISSVLKKIYKKLFIIKNLYCKIQNGWSGDESENSAVIICGYKGPVAIPLKSK